MAKVKRNLSMNWKELIHYFVCYIMIGIIWQSYEQIRYGELNPDIFDTLIASVLAYTIVMVWKIGVHWKSAEHEIEQYGKAVVDLNDIILRQKKVIAEQNKTMLRLGTITARKKDIASEKMLSALEKYADPDYYSILNDRDVYEGEEGQQLEPIGTLARKTIDRTKNMIRN
ncbi:hypothetical protein EalM137_00038 [Exiguobacterium phage vB_EalM-137]|nr:hypothetical protein EalM137_00038 [Exiguobacterium phage vB_EalM-137]